MWLFWQTVVYNSDIETGLFLNIKFFIRNGTLRKQSLEYLEEFGCCTFGTAKPGPVKVEDDNIS